METPQRIQWSREAIEAFLKEEDLGYQRIDLGHGLHTPGRDRSDFIDRIFGSSLRGKSVFDVGSYLGSFCLEALARGASRAVGWEINPDRIRQAKTLAEIKGLAPEYYERDIELEPIGEQFDIVLCLNVLHHLRNPLRVLDELIDATRERLVLEIRAMDRLDALQLGMSRATRVFLERLPVVVVGHGMTGPRGGGEGKGSSHTFLFSKPSLTRILGSHRKVFVPLGSIDTFDTGFKHRFGIIAEKRRIEHLLVIAGPSGSGKTTLIRELQSGGQEALRAALGIGERSYRLLMANRLDQGRSESELGRVDHLILHYDTLRPWQRSAVTFEHDESLDVLRSAERISIVTLVVDPAVLRERRLRTHRIIEARDVWQDRIRVSLRHPRRALSALLNRRARVKNVVESRRRDDVIRRYSEPNWVKQRYEEWFRYCRSLSELLPIASHHALRNDALFDLQQGSERVLADYPPI